MDIEWNWAQSDHFLDEQFPADTLDREKYATYLYKICAARGEKSNLVVNINAEWGAGKSYFTKRLANSISAFHPTVYIDAWKDDFSEDPLLTVFSSIKEQLSGQSDDFTRKINETVEKIGPLLKSATPVIINGLVKKLTGIEDIAELTKDLSTKLLDLHTEKASSISAVKKGISTWVNHIENKDLINKSLPLFVIIDELDRCRPDFAINLLEITKHIFNIPGVVFIIATDTEQLQHSIKVVYGNEFSASHYLSRFFDRRFLLPTPIMRDFLKTISADNVIEEFDKLKTRMSPQPPNFDIFIENCANIFESLRMNLRDSIKLYEKLIDILITAQKNFDPTFLLLLSIINNKDNEIYSLLKAKKTDKTILSKMDSSITLCFDLSRSTTLVNVLMSNGVRLVNELRDEIITVDISDYIFTARSVIEIKSPVSSNGSHYPEEWIDGGLPLNNTVNNFLKIGWASTKTHDLSLNLNQYFELIELSTTFE
ncbi:P-loop NTPase fold protein [Enterobacter sp. 170198]|uniref:P-loop NTPase fold protein n=1 Tax=Enterobacter chinensis TaxID=3030997 RepID=A0ABU5CZY7_9ENTR|nr:MULTISPECIES: P-loop NTPase fold protein [Enterobacteriaceae]MDY0417288.1 P-loop NTPase fold protein [Enterobacter sp. 170198]TFB23677.1 NTPase KAP [Lelliottia nimipressuralis]